jgi:uncharacterized protein HemX
MLGITAIVATIALLAALGALWMVTEAVKKIDGRTRRIVDIQMKGLKSSFSELAKLVQKNTRNQEALVSRIRDLVKTREAATLEIDSLKRQVDALSDQSSAALTSARRKA